LIRLIIANPASIFCLNSAAIRKKIELSYQKLTSLKFVTLFHTHSLHNFLTNTNSSITMITELATIDIKHGTNADFETNLEQAKGVISQSKGFISIEVKHCIEQPSRYVLLIHWQTLEDHTIGFRESELFVQWRALIGPFFENPPLVLHYESVN
jgi:heme-degrading monooxygenase HmoA